MSRRGSINLLPPSRRRRQLRDISFLMAGAIDRPLKPSDGLTGPKVIWSVGRPSITLVSIL
jgi:hypothetical protein